MQQPARYIEALQHDLLASREETRMLVEKLLTARSHERGRLTYDVHDALTRTAEEAHNSLEAFASRYMQIARSQHASGTITTEDLNHFIDDLQKVLAEVKQTLIDSKILLRVTKLPAHRLALYQTQLQHVHLAPRELQVLSLMAAGRTNQAIAEELYIAPATVKNYVESIIKKLGCSTRTEASVKAVAEGIIDYTAGD